VAFGGNSIRRYGAVQREHRVGGVPAVAAFVRKSGTDADAVLANLGTFVGALCFLAAALMLLPRRPRRPRRVATGSYVPGR
jgi:hypothetical protein